MAIKRILCLQKENVFQAFARAVKTGVFPANAKLIPLKVGVPQPETPTGYVTVGTVLIRPREAFAVGVAIEPPPVFEAGV